MPQEPGGNVPDYPVHILKLRVWLRNWLRVFPPPNPLAKRNALQRVLRVCRLLLNRLQVGRTQQSVQCVDLLLDWFTRRRIAVNGNFEQANLLDNGDLGNVKSVSVAVTAPVTKPPLKLKIERGSESAPPKIDDFFWDTWFDVTAYVIFFIAVFCCLHRVLSRPVLFVESSIEGLCEILRDVCLDEIRAHNCSTTVSLKRCFRSLV